LGGRSQGQAKKKETTSQGCGLEGRGHERLEVSGIRLAIITFEGVAKKFLFDGKKEKAMGGCSKC